MPLIGCKPLLWRYVAKRRRNEKRRREGKGEEEKIIFISALLAPQRANYFKCD
jgi:hypothetical protein